MKTLLADIFVSIRATLLLAVLLCGVFPLVVWAAAQTLFPRQANGSLVIDSGGLVRGSTLLAQNFSADVYFHPRASAAGTGYDAASSGGTNLGPTSRKLSDAIQAAVAAYRAENHLASNAPVPADAVTSSASGLDPDISLANARIQAARVARARGLPAEAVLALVARNVEDRDLHLFGEPRVNVLMLNQALGAPPTGAK